MFVHLVDAAGEIVTGEDSFPRLGKEKTSLWRIDQFTADPHILIVPQDAPVGEGYRLEVGLYYLPTMERVWMVDGNGNPISDKIVIAPFHIVD